MNFENSSFLPKGGGGESHFVPNLEELFFLLILELGECLPVGKIKSSIVNFGLKFALGLTVWAQYALSRFRAAWAL